MARHALPQLEGKKGMCPNKWAGQIGIVGAAANIFAPEIFRHSSFW